MSTKPDVFTRFPSPQNLVSPQYQTLGFGKLIRIDRLVDQCSSGKGGVQRKNDQRQNAGTDGTFTSYLASVKRIGDVPSGRCEKIDLANSDRFFGRPKMYPDVADVVYKPSERHFSGR